MHNNILSVGRFI